MTTLSNFVPILPTVSITTNATGSASIALGTAAPQDLSAPSGPGAGTFPAGFALSVTNAGTTTAFLQMGMGAAATATATTSMPLLAGNTRVLDAPAGCTHLSAINASGTTTIYATPGQGKG